MKYDLKLAMLRMHAGLTQEEAAAKLGISRSALIRYENGYEDIPISVLIKMTALYDFDIAAVSGIKEPQPGTGFKYDVPQYYVLKAHVMYEAKHSWLIGDDPENLEKLIYRAIKDDMYYNKALLLTEFEKDKANGFKN